jgi:hypothetical protein
MESSMIAVLRERLPHATRLERIDASHAYVAKLIGELVVTEVILVTMRFLRAFPRIMART